MNMNEPPCVPDPLCIWLNRAVESGASDLHLTVGYPPIIRLHGDLTELDWPALNQDELQEILCALCPAEALGQLDATKNMDFSFTSLVNEQIVRFRANLFHS